MSKKTKGLFFIISGLSALFAAILIAHNTDMFLPIVLIALGIIWISTAILIKINYSEW